ncbi:FUN14 domain-containing protein 1 isoform X1 [Eupeodes corollae]|uniref:FUN14 domain-containing protein 1 isoform X1 n=1 Tax=Eupeodes corollae TaxID=290404 RepID=UPI00248F95AF|nr:FUN14 domain-containing protein 1 isoform X1 [Eupeodes corollae]XP_055917746.1 FUN14 domain-containing protein 1 isoform X1 [Eupeodes corollae]
MSDWTKSKKEISNNKEIEKMSESASKFLGGVLGDISSRSAYSQLFIGVASGWATGYATGKIGKIAAFAIGGGIIVMEIAHQEGYIKVDWSKVTKKIDKVTDKVEEAVTGHERSWADKAERFVDRKLDRAEEIIKNKAKKGKKWYSNLIGDENGPKLNDLHIFLTAFVGGVAIGIASA